MNKKPNEKPIFLYIVIGILTVAVIALAAVSFLSLNHLVTLQQKVQTLSKTVEEISTDANTLISQADQLDLNNTLRRILLANNNNKVSILTFKLITSSSSQPAHTPISSPQFIRNLLASL